MASSKNGIRKPYVGDRRALVLAFDVGTTFSGVSYAFLEPGEVPKIHGVTRYTPLTILRSWRRVNLAYNVDILGRNM